MADTTKEAFTTHDAFPEAMQGRIGGPLGKHWAFQPGRWASKAGMWFTAGPWALLIAIVAWLLSIARQLPCHQSDVTKTVNNYYRMCYSDVPILYQVRELYHGESTYKMEYPILTNVIVDFCRWVAHLFGAKIGPDIGGQDALDGANIFFAVTVVFMFICFLITVAFHIDTVRTRPFDAFMVAGAPTLILSALINWDMLCIMLCTLAVWAWARSKPTLAGIFIGLGIAAKLYPFLLLVPLFALCLRTKKYKEFVYTVLGTVGAWAVPNLIVYLKAPEEWLVFWTFNVDRPADLGSFYYALLLAGIKINNISGVQTVLMIVGALFVISIGLLAPRRPRFGQLAFLMVCWFLVVNKVYSPQYVLWLLPFVVLARPRWNYYIVWTVAEMLYFCAVWGHLTQSTLLGPLSGGMDKVYIASIAIRMIAEIGLMILVIWEIIHPELDIVRANGVDDPSGGIFDHAEDAPYISKMLAEEENKRQSKHQQKKKTVTGNLAANSEIKPTEDTAPGERAAVAATGDPASAATSSVAVAERNQTGSDTGAVADPSTNSGA